MLTLKQLVIDATATLGSPLLVCKAATIAVKVLGPQTLDMGGKAVIPVEFDSLEIYIYYRDGKPMVAGRATAIRVADKL